MSDNKTSGFSSFDSTTSKNSEINKDTKEFQLKLSDEEIKDLIERVCKTHKENLSAVLNILS